MANLMSIEIQGLDDLIYLLAQAGDQATQLMGEALYAEANLIFNESQALVPVRYGILRGSGYVTEPAVTDTGIEVTVGYGGPAAAYALYVHERVFGPTGQLIAHDAPTQAKFLEQPALRAAQGMGERMGQRIASRLFHGGALPVTNEDTASGGGSVA